MVRYETKKDGVDGMDKCVAEPENREVKVLGNF